MESQETSILSDHIVYIYFAVLSNEKSIFFAEKTILRTFSLLERNIFIIVRKSIAVYGKLTILLVFLLSGCYITDRIKQYR